MSPRTRRAALGAALTGAAYFALLGWVTAAYWHITPPAWVPWLLGLVYAAFAAFIGMFILFARRDARDHRA